MKATITLSPSERKSLRRHKIKIAEMSHYTPNELEDLLQVPPQRAKELFALADFQRIPSIGIKFAEDLIFMGFYSVEELRDQDGAALRDAYEQKKGYRIDSCVEDQFRLAVYFAQTQDASKQWWDFTAERKNYREEHGYPIDRPETEWHEVLRS